MTTYRIGTPSEVKRWLLGALPPQGGTCLPVVRVQPRDRRERKCAAYEADHYEVQAFYTTTGSESLARLEAKVRELPGVYVTTQVCGRGRGGNEVTNPAWPLRLGPSRRGFHQLRPQVIALIRD